MGNFLFGLVCTAALFAFSTLTSSLIIRFFPQKKKNESEKSKAEIYYISGIEEKPKRKAKKSVAIRGELLSKSQFSKLTDSE